MTDQQYQTRKHEIGLTPSRRKFIASLTSAGAMMIGGALTRVIRGSESTLPARHHGSSKAERILIVYLSRTQNTEEVAKIIHQSVGGDLVEIEMETPYPKDYTAIVAQVDKENEVGYLPPLRTKIENMGAYEMVFVGFPTWDMQLPPPMKSFLKKYDLSGKTVIPFNTNGGFGIGSSFQNFKDLCPRSKLTEGFSIEGGKEKEGLLLAITGKAREEARAKVSGWLRSLELPKH